AKITDAQALIWYPAEADVSIRPGWFYHKAEDDKVKSVKKLLDIYYGSVGRNCVLLMNIPPNKKGLISQSDVDTLMKWSHIVEKTFKKNLARKATVVSKNGLHAEALLDGDYKTYWITQNKDTSATIVFNLKGKKTFDVLLLQEEISIGQRIERFQLDFWNGTKWEKITEGTTVGYKRLLRFHSISTKKVRLQIKSSRLNPTLAEFGLFNRPDN